MKVLGNIIILHPYLVEKGGTSSTSEMSVKPFHYFKTICSQQTHLLSLFVVLYLVLLVPCIHYLRDIFILKDVNWSVSQILAQSWVVSANQAAGLVTCNGIDCPSTRWKTFLTVNTFKKSRCRKCSE